MPGLLLDTHALLWWTLGDDRLPPSVRQRITEADPVFVSAASAWEVRTKHRLGKLPEVDPVLVAGLAAAVARMGFRELPITFADGDLAGAMAGAHRDPFDRMLIAQALNHHLTLVSNEALFDAFGVVRVW